MNDEREIIPNSGVVQTRTQRSAIDELFIQLATIFLLVFLPLIMASDISAIGLSGTSWQDDARRMMIMVGCALQAIAGVGIWNHRRWGIVMLILSVPVSLGMAIGAELILLFLGMRWLYRRIWTSVGKKH